MVPVSTRDQPSEPSGEEGKKRVGGYSPQHLLLTQRNVITHLGQLFAVVVSANILLLLLPLLLQTPACSVA
jgi:hypothetical protein